MHILVIVTDSVAPPLSCSPRLTTYNFPAIGYFISEISFTYEPCTTQHNPHATFLVWLFNPGARRRTKHRKTLTYSARRLTQFWVTVTYCAIDVHVIPRSNPRHTPSLNHPSKTYIVAWYKYNSNNCEPTKHSSLSSDGPVTPHDTIYLLLIITTHSNWFNYTNFHDPQQFLTLLPQDSNSHLLSFN